MHTVSTTTNNLPLLTKVKNSVLCLEPAADVILFGSRSRNDHEASSDWDFLVLVDGKVDTARTDRDYKAFSKLH